MATLAVQTCNRTGVVPTRNACAGGGDKFLNTGVESVLIANNIYSGAALTINNVARTGTTVTVTTTTDPTLVFVPGDTIVVAAVTNPSINGTFPITSMDSGAKTITYTDITSGTIASGADTGTVGGGPRTITFTVPATIDGEAVTNRTATIAAGVEKWIGPFPASVYSDTNNDVNLTYSGSSSMTVAVLAPGV